MRGTSIMQNLELGGQYMSYTQETPELARFMMYFKPSTLGEIRVLSRMLNLAMVDFVSAAMEAYIFAREFKMGTPVPPRDNERFIGPRTELTGKRIRYVMRLHKESVEKIRDIAFMDNRRFTNICDEALSDFIAYTKEVKNFKNVWLSRLDVEAVRGRKGAKAQQKVAEILDSFKARIVSSGSPSKRG
jgi:hypothetical protein